MSLFPKTGIKQTRVNNQSQEIDVQTVIRRVVIFPRTTQSLENQAGIQENADYILYGETGDSFLVDDYVYFNLDELYSELAYSTGSNVIKCQVKEPSKKYGTLKLNNRNQEVFLKSLN